MLPDALLLPHPRISQLFSVAIVVMETLEGFSINLTLSETIAGLRALREEEDKGKLEAAAAECMSRISPLDSDTDGNEGESEMADNEVLRNHFAGQIDDQVKDLEAR